MEKTCHKASTAFINDYTSTTQTLHNLNRAGNPRSYFKTPTSPGRPNQFCPFLFSYSVASRDVFHKKWNTRIWKLLGGRHLSKCLHRSFFFVEIPINRFHISPCCSDHIGQPWEFWQSLENLPYDRFTTAGAGVLKHIESMWLVKCHWRPRNVMHDFHCWSDSNTDSLLPNQLGPTFIYRFDYFIQMTLFPWRPIIWNFQAISLPVTANFSISRTWSARFSRFVCLACIIDLAACNR